MKMEFALDKSVEIKTTLMTPMSHGAHQGADFLLKHAGKPTSITHTSFFQLRDS